MRSTQRIRKTDLARNTRRVIDAVLRGRTAVVESHGQPEVVIMDVVDYCLTRAVLRYYTQPPAIDPQADLDRATVATRDLQDRFDLVLAHYLAGAIGLERAAELLGLTWLDLYTRFLRLDVPLPAVPQGLAGAGPAAKSGENGP